MAHDYIVLDLNGTVAATAAYPGEGSNHGSALIPLITLYFAWLFVFISNQRKSCIASIIADPFGP